MRDFFQSPPVLQNPYLNDPLIQTYLKRTLPTDLLMEIEPELKQLGKGTTDVLSLDCLRAIEKEHSAPAFLEDTRRLLSEIHHPELMASVQKTLHGLAVIKNTLQQSSEEKTSNLHYSARALAFTVARVYAGALLLSHAQWEITHSTSFKITCHSMV